MGRTLFTRRVIAAIASAMLLAGCTTHKQETPSLTGPSALGTSLVITLSPSVLSQDGASQSLVQITAYDSNGQPLRNASLRVEILVSGAITDFGRLSARNVVTDANGRASVTYTAPAPIFGVTSDVLVDIAVTPAESDFANATMRFATIRLVPVGVIGPPRSSFIPNFAPPAATVGNPTVFSATFTGTDPNAQVITFVWDFGDGDTAVGQTVQHTFDNPGTFLVTLALVDTLGRSNEVSKSVTVGQGTLPTADIIVSPSAPAVGQTINFIGSGSTAEPGHRIVDYSWNFGDGTVGNGEVVQHSYHTAGNYTVTLRVTDDVGRRSVLKQTSVSVTATGGGGGGSGATATFSVSPPSPSAPASGTVQVTFDASASTPSQGGIIISYVWTFNTGSPATGQQTTRALAPGTYQVTLTVTDSQGKTGTASQELTVTST